MKKIQRITKTLFCALLTSAFAFSSLGCNLGQVIQDVSSGLDNIFGDSDSSVNTDTDNMGDNSATDSDTGDTGNPDTDSSATDSETSDTATDSEGSGEEEKLADALSIHFLELGNYYAGDCTLIDIGDTEILIDAGSRKDSATTIKKYVDQYCEDGVLEYVIATHAHQDHIAAFVGNFSGGSYTGILYQYQIGTIIQFSKTNSTSQIYNAYKTAVEYAKGKGTTVHTVLDCWNNANGAQRSYQLGDGITMNFLYQKYYETKTSDENDYSVCMLLTQGENNYLFTGDLEKDGEASLVASNNLPKCKVYKGGHHGSKTSSTAALLAAIQPEIVCVCCCAGTDEYTDNQANQFPTQDFIDRVAPYTDKVYVTTGKNNSMKMNGNITVSCPNGKNVTVTGSNNSLILKGTTWFKAERRMPDAWK